MEKHTENIHNGSTPKVVIVYTGEDLKQQDYPNYEIVGGVTDDAPGLFNEFIQQGFEENSIVGFISQEYNFVTEDAVSQIVDKLAEATIIGSVYSDIVVKAKEHYLEPEWKVSKHYLPPFHGNLLKQGTVIMSPLFVKSNLLTTQRFNPALKRLYYALFFLLVSQRILSCHIPVPLYERYHIRSEQPSTIEEDYRHIQKWLTQLET